MNEYLYFVPIEVLYSLQNVSYIVLASPFFPC